MFDEFSKLKLIENIFEAFAEVPHPERNVAPCGCGECRDLERAFHDASSGASWQTLPPSFIEDHFGDLPLFSPEAFHYVLPAYLVHALRNYDNEDSNVREWTIYTLTPGKEPDSKKLWRVARFSPFTAEQMRVIYEYLALIRRDPDAYDFYKDIDRGLPRLQKYSNNED